MKHHDKNKKLGRTRNQRTALKRGLVQALVDKESIKTTEAKAKDLRPTVEKLITRAKTDTVANRRLVAARLGNDEKTTKKLFDVIGPRYKDRLGGYTRIVKIAQKPGSARKEAVIDLV